jgi:hypothetical protein
VQSEITYSLSLPSLPVLGLAGTANAFTKAGGHGPLIDHTAAQPAIKSIPDEMALIRRVETLIGLVVYKARRRASEETTVASGHRHSTLTLTVREIGPMPTVLNVLKLLAIAATTITGISAQAQSCDSSELVSDFFEHNPKSVITQILSFAVMFFVGFSASLKMRRK